MPAIQRPDNLPRLQSRSPVDLIRALPEAAVASARLIHDWLLAAPHDARTVTALWGGFCDLLLAQGVPVARGTMVIETLHAEHYALGEFWTADGGAQERRFTEHTPGGSQLYLRSPFYEAHQTRSPVELWLPETDDSRFGIVPELKADGFTHYVCCPMFFADGGENGMTIATRAPRGFSKADIQIIELLTPHLTAAAQIIAGRDRLDAVLSTYLGDDPHQRVLSGQIRRGEMTEVSAAILFADMRDSTRITEGLPPAEVAALFNAYFDCIVPPIEAAGGGVLKYIGDGLLAVFRDEAHGAAAAASALFAARQGLARLAAANAEGRFRQPVAAGMALHHGVVSYGNIGSGARLDFTVVGSDVNLANRVARLNRPTGEPVLMTEAFASRMPSAQRRLGAHQLQDVSGPTVLFAPTDS